MTIQEFGDGTGGTSGPGIASAPMNNNFKALQIAQVSTTTSLNGSETGASGGSTARSFEFDAITASDLGNAVYLKTDLNFTGYVLRDDSNGSGTIAYKIETKEVGGSYSDSLASVNLLSAIPSSEFYSNYNSAEFSWLHTLTAGEISNGVQVKITVTVTNTGNGSTDVGQASFTLRQAVLGKLG